MRMENLTELICCFYFIFPEETPSVRVTLNNIVAVDIDNKMKKKKNRHNSKTNRKSRNNSKTNRKKHNKR